MIKQYWFVSPGRVGPEALAAHNKHFNQVSRDISLSSEEDSIEIIAHGAGSWRYYPMGINRKGVVYGNGFKYKKTPASSITNIINKTLDYNPNISIELDVHYPPNGHSIAQKYEDGAYVIHDKPEWDKNPELNSVTENYLHNNTLNHVLQNHIKNNHIATSAIYIELKVSSQNYFDTSRSSQEPHRLAKQLTPYLRANLRNDRTNWIGITSFSPVALKLFRSNLPDDLKDKVDYILIAGYTGGRLKGKLAQSKGFVPRFNEEIKNFAIKTEWLDYIWFSAQGIKEFTPEFNSVINQRRIYHPHSSLEFSFSTYQKKRKPMDNLLKEEIIIDANICSYMLDIDDKPTK